MLKHQISMDDVSLRDYFAARAMQAMCEEVSRYNQFIKVAEDAYKMADAMMQIRDKSK